MPRRLPSMSSCAFSGRRRLAQARLGAAVSRRSATRVSRRAPLATRVFDLDAVLIAQLLAHAVGRHKVAIEARMQSGREQLIHLRRGRRWRCQGREREGRQGSRVTG